MDREVRGIFERLGVAIDPERIARGLSIAEQQLVEIAKALTRQARVLIMDEPTAALSPVEAKRLFTVVETLRGEGAAIVFISHRLEEVFALCQRVTVLRDGKRILSQTLDRADPDDLIRAMVGRDLVLGEPELHRPGETVLSVQRLTREGVFVDISFEVRAGEVVALAGLVGSGRSEVANAIFGIDSYDAGSVQISGRRLPGGSPTAAMRAGVGLVTEDRRQHGLVMEMSTAHNIALASLGRLRHGGLISGRSERAFAAEWAQRLQVRYGKITNPVSLFSGGNQQKVVLAKWLARKPSLLIVDEPTRGIDVGTKSEVHRLISSLAGDGVAVLVVSSELPEVLTLADRVLVMREGRLVASMAREQATEEAIVAAGTGRRANGDGRRGQRRRSGLGLSTAAQRRPAQPRRTQPTAPWTIRAASSISSCAPARSGSRHSRPVRDLTTLVRSSFLSGSNIRFVLAESTLYALVAIGETFVVLTRNVDLSVGSVVGLSAYVSANMFQAHHGIAIPVVFAVGIAIGLACGVVTGLITAIGACPAWW